VPRLFLLLALLAGAYITLILYRQASPENKRKWLWRAGISAVLIITVFAAATGKASWLGAIAAGLIAGARRWLPLIIRYLPMLGQLIKRSGVKAAKISSGFIEITIEPSNGNIDGTVLQGRFTDKKLSELSEQELEELAQDCQDDAKARRLLTAFRLRNQKRQQQHTQPPPPTYAQMGRKEALAILGLSEDCDKADIVKAHKKLIQKMHPDRGGSDFLAAQINQAKDTLIG